jgi:nucleotide-binding universal stress UspA family protein
MMFRQAIKGGPMKIMVGYYNVTLDSKIVSTALGQAKAFGATLYLTTSLQVGEDVPKTDFDMAEDTLARGKQFFLDQGVDCVIRLLETNLETGEALVQFAVENQMDELIIGVRNRSKLGKILFGSTAQYVILKAPCPVLSVIEEESSTNRG